MKPPSRGTTSGTLLALSTSMHARPAGRVDARETMKRAVGDIETGAAAGAGAGTIFCVRLLPFLQLLQASPQRCLRRLLRQASVCTLQRDARLRLALGDALDALVRTRARRRGSGVTSRYDDGAEPHGDASKHQQRSWGCPLAKVPSLPSVGFLGCWPDACAKALVSP